MNGTRTAYAWALKCGTQMCTKKETEEKSVRMKHSERGRTKLPKRAPGRFQGASDRAS